MNHEHIDPSRRKFLAAGAAGMLMAGMARAQSPSPAAGAAGLAEILYPGAVQNGRYVLPDLRYPYDALEPHIDAETMQLHHSRHHKSYVDGLIQAEEQLAKMRQNDEWDQVEHWEQKAAFHGAGHFLHAIFWVCMGPEGRRGEPSQALARRIEQDFGSHDAMLAQFRRASQSVEGNGWGLLTWSIPAQKLVVLQARNHQNATQWANIPLLVIDVWEHAYYKKYGPGRADYINAFLEVVDWADVSRRFEAVAGLA